MTVPALEILAAPPAGLFNYRAHELMQVLNGPTLIHIRGRRQPALFVSVLLHGNETSGWEGLCQYMANGMPERDLLLFVGNLAAAER